MSYREKLAWLSLGAVALTFGPYFAIVAAGASGTDAMPNLGRLSLLGIAVVAQALLILGGRLVLSLRFREDSRASADERDLAIERRSVVAAYYVLIVGMIVVGCVMPFNSGGWAIVDTGLLAIVAAELVHYGVAVANYRKQA